MTDQKASNQWTKSDKSYQNYMLFIHAKQNYQITFIDLLYVSNFKGGSATINEEEEIVNNKLKNYSVLFSEIKDRFSSSLLCEITSSDTVILIDLANKAIGLTDVSSSSKIDGFGVSYLTTLLHFYFPNLLPILDRRVLHGLNLLKESDISSDKQIKDIKRFYPDVIKAFQLNTFDKTIRKFDEELFIKPITNAFS